MSSKECSSILLSSSPFLTNLHPIRGSYLNAYTMAMIDSLLFLSNLIIFSQVCLKIPITPQGYIALTSILVNLKGTF